MRTRRAPAWIALLLVAGLAVPAPIGAAEAADDPVEVNVRIEGRDATIWTGTVTLDGTYELTADTSGETYTLDAHTPLGALHGASRQGGFELTVSDDWGSTDFVVEAVDGVWAGGVHWWDYRVEWVRTYYGNQHGWLAHGPGLEDGDRVLWYLETTGSRPLRLDVAEATPPGPTPHAPDGAAAFRIEWPVADPNHRAGKPWPTQVWAPAHATEIQGDVDASAPGGAAVVPLEEGTYRARAVADDAAWPVSTVRSNPVTVVVD